MPENVWYEPLADVECAVVGNATHCNFEGESDAFLPWAFEEENNAFVACFTGRAVPTCQGALARSCEN